MRERRKRGGTGEGGERSRKEVMAVACLFVMSRVCSVCGEGLGLCGYKEEKETRLADSEKIIFTSFLYLDFTEWSIIAFIFHSYYVCLFIYQLQLINIIEWWVSLKLYNNMKECYLLCAVLKQFNNQTLSLVLFIIYYMKTQILENVKFFRFEKAPLKYHYFH